MPISEDEFDSHQISNNNSHHHHQSNMSKAELRRSNKPIMEKRRRARINHCLNELKALILDAMKKDPARHSKLEKADILEMTVKHLQTVQRQQLAVAVATDPTVMHKFKSGFNECAGEVSRYISSMEGIDSGVKQRLVGHLSTCVTGLQQITPFSFPGMASGSLNIGSASSTINIPLQPNPTNVPIVVPPVPFSSGDVNNNGSGTRIQMPGGIQLIPSRLPTGELALLVPNSSNLPFFPSTSLGNPQQDFPPQPPPQADSSSSLSIESSIKSAHYQSAFTSVSRSKSPSGHHKLSPPLSPSSPSTSYTEENLHSENFHRTSTPSPHIRTQKTITAPYPTPPNQPSGDKSTFTTSSSFLADSCQKSQQQPHVTSTSISPESKVVSSSDLKIGYKSVPIYQHVEKHRHYSVKAETSSRAQSMDQPLTVITTDKYKIPLVHQEYHVLPTSSMSPRKRPYKSSVTDRLLVVANQPSSPKVMKYSTEVVSSSQTYRGTSASPENLTNKTADSTFSTDSSFGTSPSTSASSGSGTSNVSGSTESMWRPW